MSESADLSSWTQHPHRLAVDAKGYVWRVYDDGIWSMAPTNGDNSPTPEPVTFYDARLNAENQHLREREKEIGSIILNGAPSESDKWETAVAIYLRHEAHAVDCAECSDRFRAMADQRDKGIAEAEAERDRLRTAIQAAVQFGLTNYWHPQDKVLVAELLSLIDPNCEFKAVAGGSSGDGAQ